MANAIRSRIDLSNCNWSARSCASWVQRNLTFVNPLGDGELPCKRGFVRACALDDHPSMRSTRRLPCGERTTHAFCSILLRVPCHRPTSPPAVVRSYRTVSPLPDRNRSCAIGGVFSVARDVRFPRPGSRQHSVLRSPDFPQPRTKCATAVTRLTRRRRQGYWRH